MNMLIIGNGFDLAHKRPTTYADFLRFLDYILLAKDFLADRAQLASNLDEDIECCSVKDFILSSFDTRKNPGTAASWNKNPMIQELYECLDKNVWYEYFQLIYGENEMHGKNWIDFENEIRKVIEFFDREIEEIYDELSPVLTSPQNVPIKIARFCKGLDFSEYNQIKRKSNSHKNTYYDLVEKSYLDLQKLVRCLEIYLDVCVGKMPIQVSSPDIQGLAIDFILSFNYTTIPTDIYPTLANVYPHYIHGQARSDCSSKGNNMVLGVNEYWEGDEKNTHTNFNLYKKFVQRIIKETGIGYKRALNYMRSENNKRKTILEGKNADSPYTNHIYIFGHSLDVTDGDILREIIKTDDADTTIFYRSKQQQANQIANLSKVLGQEYLLAHTFSIAPTIIFKQQAEMVTKTSS